MLSHTNSMATHQVNLDAMIQREDFESGDAAGIPLSDQALRLSDLQASQTVFKLLRKPEFQRTTDNWEPKKIANFIKAFLDEELIPALVLWQSKLTNKIFVVDGAHRLGALIAWVNDDYGNGKLSQAFFGEDILPGQKKLDKATRQVVEAEIGRYEDMAGIAFDTSGQYDATTISRAQKAAYRTTDCQYVDGDAAKAERAFLAINKNPAIIDKIQLDIIQARAKPNSIAIRAVISAAKGHKYWGHFEDKKAEIESLAKDIYNTLFGEIVELSPHSPDIPRAGEPYSTAAFKLIMDLVNVFNGITPSMWQASLAKADSLRLPDDTDGSATVECLRNAKEVADLVSGNEKGSVGLDPAVYVYGKTGKFHAAALLAAMKFAQTLERENRLIQFTTVRHDFEEFLVRHKSFINQLGHTIGGGLKPMNSLVLMHTVLFEQLLGAKKTNTDISDEVIIDALKQHDVLKKLEPGKIRDDEVDPNVTKRKRFSAAATAAATVREKIAQRPRCHICEARCPEYARSKSHKKDIKHGGLGTEENLEFAHHFCNNSLDRLREIGFVT